MKINNINKSPNFKAMELAPLSRALYTLGNNDMLNASFIDIFAMDTPRTIIETKNRGKQAGFEMGFREYTGTFIAEFSAICFALLTSKIFSKKYKQNIKINPDSWLTNSAIDTFDEIYKNSDKTLFGFVGDVLNSVSGISGKQKVNFSDIDKNTANKIKENLVNFIQNSNNFDSKSKKRALEAIKDDIIYALKADNSITIKSSGKQFSDNLSHVLRDIVDASNNVFFKNGADSNAIVSKLKTLNKSRIAIAIPLSMLIAITNQYINRQWTKKRTGIDNFVGENDYEKNVSEKNQTKKEKGLLLKKLLSAGVFSAMLFMVMGIKKPSDIVKKLEFNGPATGGNAIKTIYGTLILGRIFAAKDSTELRETNVRDYLGFLNWLVLGGFVAKGVGGILDNGKGNLFNISKDSKGIRHWLKNVSLKSQKEIIAQGGNVKSNLMKLNIAQMAGIGYSALMLGILLPKLNILMTRKNKNEKPSMPDTLISKKTPEVFKGFLKQKDFAV